MSLRWRLGAVGGMVILFAFLAVANLVDPDRRQASPLLPDGGLRLGLDLRGGIHWVLGPQLEVAVEHELEHLRASLAADLEERGVEPLHLRSSEGRIELEAARQADLEAIREAVGEIDVLDVTRAEGLLLELALDPGWAREVRESGMQQALEVLRRRIDDPATGIPESVVTRQGADRILVQIPGVERVPEGIIKTTGFLEFKIVLDRDENPTLLRARHPEGLPEATEILVERDKETERVLAAYLVRQAPDLTGDYLADARVGFDQRRQRWLVNFTFKPEGGKIFQELTAKNRGEQLAIVLDNRVYSAPVIRERIGSRGQIEGRFSSQEAADLAVILRSGSLPIPVVIEEERTIGPALGADSIRRGVQASVIGLVLVVAFTVFYYRLSGLYASVALFSNLVLIVGLMSLAGATLTLPGIAGIVLTVGMAIDANVIIFERIREELRQGRTPRAAIGTGFKKALWTVLDANITTLITAIVLYEYGTGPIKGFAVTLSVGIVTSVFSAMVITRLLFDLHPGPRTVRELSI